MIFDKLTYNQDGYSDVIWACHTNWEKRLTHPVIGMIHEVKSNYGYPNYTFHRLKKNGGPYASGISMENQGRQYTDEVTRLQVFPDQQSCLGYFLNECDKEIKIYEDIKNEVINEN